MSTNPRNRHQFPLRFRLLQVSDTSLSKTNLVQCKTNLFRQVKDASIRRGYYQKSVILLTYLPLISFYTNLTNIVAKKYYESGDVSIEAACHDINR